MRLVGSGAATTGAGHAGRMALVAGLGLALYLPRLGAEILRSPLEVKYALAAREMLRGTSPLLVPHLFGEPYPDKPPLYFWATAALGWLTGGDVTEVVARLPAALAAVAALALTCRLGADLFGPRAGVLSACVLATSNLYFWYARQGHPDQFLTAFVTLACWGLWRTLGATDPADRRRWTVVAYAAMGLGILSKGLLGLLLPLFAAAGYLALTGPVAAVPRRLRLHPGLLITAGVSLAWYGAAVAQGGTAYLYETLVHQHLIRYLHGWVHEAPWHRYLGDFPVGFLPWVLFLPGAIAAAWRAGHARAPDPADPTGSAALEPEPRAGLFPLAWFAVGFVFLSLSSTKRDVYLLPLYPAAALMVGRLWDRALDARAVSRWLGIPLRLLCGAAVLVAGTLLLPRGWVSRHLDPASRADIFLPADPWSVAMLAGALLVGAGGIWWAARRGRLRSAFAMLVAVQVSVLAMAAAVRAPQYEARYPVRALLARADAVVPAGQEILTTLRQHSLLLVFYSPRPMALYAGVPELLASRAASRAPRYAFVDDDARPRGEPGVVLLEAMRFGKDRVALIQVDPAVH